MLKFRDYQNKSHKATMDYISGNRKKAGIVILPTGCHAKGYKVFKYDGSLAKVEDIKVGDLLMGNDSTPRIVLQLHNGKEKMYKVYLKGVKISFVVNENHILHLVRTNITRTKDLNCYPKVVNISIKEYLRWSSSRKLLYKLERTGFQCYNTLKTTINPYFIGLWLGDGSQSSTIITSMDYEIKDFLKDYAKLLNLDFSESKTKSKRTKNYAIVTKKGKNNPLTQLLKDLKVFKNKHIPEEFFSTHESIRESLLAGLIDSDGTNRGHNNFEILQKRKELAYDIYRLAGSLGLDPYIREVKKKCYNSKTHKPSIYYKVTFKCIRPLPIKVERKKCKPDNYNKKLGVHGFSLEELGIDEYFGFSLDNNNLYIDENFIIQHNSGKSLLQARVVHDYGKKSLIISPSIEILKQNYQKFIDYGGEASIYSAKLKSKEIGDVTYASLKSIKDLGPTFNDLGVKLLLIDECHLHTDAGKGMLQKFVSKMNPKFIVGYTATPFRLENSIGPSGFPESSLSMLTSTFPKIFNDYIHITQISDLIDNKFWADIQLENQPFDLTGLELNSTGNDFKEEAIMQRNKDNNVNNRIYKRLKELLPIKKSILVFLDSVENCHIMKNALGSQCEVIDGKTKTAERERIIRDFKAGIVKVVCCHSTLVVGFDFPELECVIMGRPTNSLAIFYQIYGRLVRPYQNKLGLFIDYGGNLSRFGDMHSITIENYRGTGYEVFYKDRMVSGTPLKGSVVTKTHLDDLVARKLRVETATEPNLEHLMKFGKYKDKIITEVPKYYLEWLLTSNLPLDLELKVTIHHILKKPTSIY